MTIKRGDLVRLSDEHANRVIIFCCEYDNTSCDIDCSHVFMCVGEKELTHNNGISERVYLFLHDKKVWFWHFRPDWFKTVSGS